MTLVGQPRKAPRLPPTRYSSLYLEHLRHPRNVTLEGPPDLPLVFVGRLEGQVMGAYLEAWIQLNSLCRVVGMGWRSEKMPFVVAVASFLSDWVASRPGHCHLEDVLGLEPVDLAAMMEGLPGSKVMSSSLILDVVARAADAYLVFLRKRSTQSGAGMAEMLPCPALGGVIEVLRVGQLEGESLSVIERRNAHLMACDICSAHTEALLRLLQRARQRELEALAKEAWPVPSGGVREESD